MGGQATWRHALSLAPTVGTVGDGLKAYCPDDLPLKYDDCSFFCVSVFLSLLSIDFLVAKYNLTIKRRHCRQTPKRFAKP